MDREELLEAVNEIEQKIWDIPEGQKFLISAIYRAWEGFTDELFEEFEADVWDDLDDQTLVQAFEYGNELLKNKK